MYAKNVSIQDASLATSIGFAAGRVNIASTQGKEPIVGKGRAPTEAVPHVQANGLSPTQNT